MSFDSKSPFLGIAERYLIEGQMLALMTELASMVLVAFGNENFDERPILRRMFRARKEVFADLLKWNVPVLAGEFEIDQFDTEEATYLLVVGENGQHHASA